MASDILQKILDAEKKAAEEISSAQREADKILLNNQSELEKFKAEIDEKSKCYVDSLMKLTEDEIVNREKESLEAARESAKSFVDNKMSKRDEAIEAVIKALL